MFNSIYTDLSTDTNIQNNQSSLLTTIKSHGINDYKDKGTFNISTLVPNTSTHITGNLNYIQELIGVDEKYIKIMLFGKYQSTNANATIDMIYSNDQAGGTSPNYTPPTNFCFGESIKGRIRHDGFYHFTHIIEGIPRYTSFFNPNITNLTNLQINYVKVI